MKRLIPLLLAAGVIVTAQGQTPGHGRTYMCVMEQSRMGTVRKINFSPYAESVINRVLADAGFEIIGGSHPPLVSREVLEYSVVSTTGRLSLLTGLVHLEAGADGSLSFTSDKGANVVLKTEVNAVHWIVDRARAMEDAIKAGAQRLLVIEVETEDLSGKLTDPEQYSSQRSISVTVAARMTAVPEGKVLAAFSESVTRMAAVESAAVRDGVEVLAPGLVQSLSKK